VGVINKGRILLVEDKEVLMSQMGKKQLKIELSEPVDAVPAGLAKYNLERTSDGTYLTYSYDAKGDRTGITTLLNDLQASGLMMRDVQTQQSSLEDIFVDLVKESR